jgi:hypothetical protein
MVYQIRYEDKGSGRQQKVARPIKNRKELMALRNSATNLRLLAKARNGDKEAKRQLVQLAYNLGYVEGSLAGCKSQGSFFFHDVDCYDAAQSEAIRELILSKKDEIGLVMLERSVSGGWHLVCKRVPGTTILENQVRVATILQLEMDTSAKDLQRVVFSTSGSDDDLVYLDDILFTEPMSREECEAEFQRLKERQKQGKEEVPAGAKKANKHFCPRPTSIPLPSGRGEAGAEVEAGAKNENKPEATPLPDGRGQGVGLFPTTYHGIPFTDIIAKYWEMNNHGFEPTKGDRDTLTYQLACDLRHICGKSFEWLDQVIPCYDGFPLEEKQQKIRNALSSEYEGFPLRLKRVLDTFPNPKTHSPLSREGESLATLEGCAETASGNESLPLRGDLEGSLAAWGMQIQAMMDDYPLLRDICKGLKPSQYPAAVFVAGGFLMTLMTRCTYHFYHMPEVARRLNCQTLIIGDPASGKSFATRLYKLLTAPIAEADREGKDAINAYRELMRTKGANKEKPKKPKVVVRIHPARTSNAQFIQDMVNAVEVVDGEPMQLHMLTFDSELDNTLSVQRGGAWIDKNSMELKAFHNEEDGQAYSNLDSILENFIVTWNYVCTGTPIALRKKVNASNVGSGLFTRLTVIPLPSTNFEMLQRQESVDYEADERLRQWAQKLNRTKGELSLQRIVDELYDWTERRMKDAEENESRADELMLKRCAYHGLNFAAPFIVMRHWDSMKEEGTFYCGEFETDETDWRLTELLLNIHYACQRHFFGHLVEEYFEEQDREASVNVQHRQKTIIAFQQLPEEFTTKDVMRCFGLTNGSTIRMRISHLIKDQLIEKVSDGRESGCETSVFRKTGRIML